MGHESPIEPWLAADNRAAWESPNRLASSRQSDENRWQKKPTALREASSVRDHRTEGQNNPAQTGWAGSQEKIRPQERCFFLDSFYRTYQDLDSRIGQTLASAAFRPRLNAEISATPIELWRAPQPSYFAPYAASPSFGVDIIPPPCHYVS